MVGFLTFSLVRICAVCAVIVKEGGAGLKDSEIGWGPHGFIIRRLKEGGVIGR